LFRSGPRRSGCLPTSGPSTDEARVGARSVDRPFRCERRKEQMAQQIPVDPDSRVDEVQTDGVHEVLPGLGYQRLAIVNVAYHGTRGAGDRWVLIDAGVTGAAGMILHAVEHLFGKGSRPAAIVLTHGHFDHVGALAELAERWEVPVYAHELELPYLDGR